MSSLSGAKLFDFFLGLTEHVKKSNEIPEEEFNKKVYGYETTSIKIRFFMDTHWVSFIHNIITFMFEDINIEDISKYVHDYYYQKNDMQFIALKIPENNKYDIDKKCFSVLFNTMCVTFLKLYTNGRIFNEEDYQNTLTFCLNNIKEHNTIPRDTTLINRITMNDSPDKYHMYGSIGINTDTEKLTTVKKEDNEEKNSNEGFIEYLKFTQGELNKEIEFLNYQIYSLTEREKHLFLSLTDSTTHNSILQEDIRELEYMVTYLITRLEETEIKSNTETCNKKKTYAETCTV